MIPARTKNIATVLFVAAVLLVCGLAVVRILHGTSQPYVPVQQVVTTAPAAVTSPTAPATTPATPRQPNRRTAPPGGRAALNPAQGSDEPRVPLLTFRSGDLGLLRVRYPVTWRARKCRWTCCAFGWPTDSADWISRSEGTLPPVFALGEPVLGGGQEIGCGLAFAALPEVIRCIRDWHRCIRLRRPGRCSPGCSCGPAGCTSRSGRQMHPQPGQQLHRPDERGGRPRGQQRPGRPDGRP